MAVALSVQDTVGAHTASPTSPVNYTGLTVASGDTDLVIWVTFGNVTTPPSAISVVWDQGGTNQSMTAVTTAISTVDNLCTVAMFRLASPTPGLKTARVTWTGSVGDIYITGASFTGGGAISGATTNHSTTVTDTISVTSGTTSMALSSFAKNATAYSTPATTGTTICLNVTGVNSQLFAIRRVGLGGATAMVPGSANTSDWVAMGVSIDPGVTGSVGSASGTGTATAAGTGLISAIGVAAGTGVATAVPLDAATTAWVNAVITNGGSVSSARQTLVNNLIVTLKAKSVWPIFDRLWLQSTENTPSALTDLVANVLATTNNSPVFTANSGYANNGPPNNDANIDTNFNPSTAPSPKYTQNSAHISAWAVNPHTLIDAIFCAQTTTPGHSAIYPYAASGNTILNCNDPAANAFNAGSTGQGHFLANRSSSTARQGYWNGRLVQSISSTATTVNNESFQILGNAFYGPYRGPDPVACVSIGGGLSDANVADFYDTLRIYMAAVGVPTLTYLSPDADNVDGGWTNESGGTTLFASLDEHLTPIDSDFIRSSQAPSSDVCKISLGNPPSGTVAQPFGVSYRYGKAGAVTLSLTVRLLEGTTQRASWTDSNVASGFTTVRQVLTTTEFNSITDFTNLFLEFTATT